MQVKEGVRELRCRQNVALDAPLCADKERLDVRPNFFHRTRDGESRIQVAAGSTAGEENAQPTLEPTRTTGQSPSSRSLFRACCQCWRGCPSSAATARGSTG